MSTSMGSFCPCNTLFSFMSSCRVLFGFRGRRNYVRVTSCRLLWRCYTLHFLSCMFSRFSLFSLVSLSSRTSLSRGLSLPPTARTERPVHAYLGIPKVSQVAIYCGLVSLYDLAKLGASKGRSKLLSGLFFCCFSSIKHMNL